MTGGVPWSISGTTRLLAVIGDPVRQVQAPALLNPLLNRPGTDAVLVPVHAGPDDLPHVVRGLQRAGNVDGLLITVPHKAAARAFADGLSPAVRLSGSTNALRREPDGRWYAENFDGAGFVAGLRAAGHAPEGRRVMLVGGGGAGSAIAAALLGAGVARLTVCEPDSGRREALLGRLSRVWPGRLAGRAVPDPEGADLAVNATPLGLSPGDPLPFAPGTLEPGAVVADIIMKPRETALLKSAAALGHPVHHGVHMLTQQLDLYREFFRLAPGR
ncbi:shikimate dehydrogenase family protein [Streptomyces sp. NPDC002514]|uniref:shikimate dehydrogenase family protein n=1 Tax=unclassified Streptomyces TaxID=2593676 RepID=UPI000D21A388|nr:shikimate dehydrogenase [Streptomyces sp.]